MRVGARTYVYVRARVHTGTYTYLRSRVRAHPALATVSILTKKNGIRDLAVARVRRGWRGLWITEGEYMGAVEKPDLRELVGRAVNASGLELHATQERALDRVAALGAAALAVRFGVDRDDLPIAAAPALVYGQALDPRDVLVGELAPLLWHIRFGYQYDQRPAGIRLFALWIGYRPLFAEYAGAAHEKLRLSFAERVMHEWLSDRCPGCRGSKKQQRSPTGQWIKPLGAMQRNAVYRPCAVCNGSGRTPVSPPQRMKALGLTREQYDRGRWDQRFNAAIQWLNRLLPKRLQRPLTAELERRKRRP